MTLPPDPSAGSLAAAWPARLLILARTRSWRAAAIAGLGGFIVIAALAQLTETLHVLLLIAPFGASSVLIFAAPASPLAQPRNVIGGHMLSSAVGIAVLTTLGHSPLTLGLAVALSIALMMLTETLHPPAGADPIVVMSSLAAWPFLLMPALLGTAIIVLVAMLYHRFVSRLPYPTSIRRKS